MEGPEIKAVEAVIDNGSFGRRTVRFETGRLARQADGAVAAYLDDDSMVLSTTTAGSSPKENYDFFPLTVDVEKCKNCKACMRIGCPAISAAEGHVTVDQTLCVGCGLCEKMCAFGALKSSAEVQG